MEDVTVSTDEGWDLAKRVDLEVLLRDTVGWVGLNNLELNVVGLGHSQNGSGAWVTLKVGC